MTGSRDLVHILADSTACFRYDGPSRGCARGRQEERPRHAGRDPGGQRPRARGTCRHRDHSRRAGGTPQSTVLGFRGEAPALGAALAQRRTGALPRLRRPDAVGAACCKFGGPGGFRGRRTAGRRLGKGVDRGGRGGPGHLRPAALQCRLEEGLEPLHGLGGVRRDRRSGQGHVPARQSRSLMRMGIATMQSSGIMEMVAGRGSDLRGLYAGFSAKGAVLAAMMAEKGTHRHRQDVRGRTRLHEHLLRRPV